MNFIKNRYFYFPLTALSILVVITMIYQDQVEKTQQAKHLSDIIDFKGTFSSQVFGDNAWPESVSIDDDELLNVEYTFNDELVGYIKKLLKSYRSDFSSIVVIENKTGKVLAAIGHQREGNKFNNSLPFSSSHPSASLFKIITSADLIENTSIDEDSTFTYRGKATTLYKYQLKTKKSKWQRKQTLKSAFAFSNNVIFGKAAINNSTGQSLYETALKFGFNKNIMSELNLSKSTFKLANDDYNLAELASGFNKKTLISPLHAAILSSIVANNGKFISPILIDTIVDSKSGEQFWHPDQKKKQVLNKETAVTLKQLMEHTVKRGTARGSFRRFPRKLRKDLDIGGKTGTITGGIPYGKRDWFTAYAVPKTKQYGNGISISVMNVNVNKWYVKSAYLARKIIQYYYTKVSPLKVEITDVKMKNADGV